MRDSMVRFDGWLRKQGISYNQHADGMVLLSNIDKLEFVSEDCMDVLDNISFVEGNRQRWLAEGNFVNAKACQRRIEELWNQLKQMPLFDTEVA